MEPTEEQLAKGFADAHRDKLSWREQASVPGRPYHWHWRQPPIERWAPDTEANAIARRLVVEFAKKRGLKIRVERAERILNLAQRHLRH
jgi:hypothetical protein